MTVYSRDQVFAASLEYFQDDDLAASVFVDKYALRDENGDYLELTPDDMHKRIAKEIARIEMKYENPMSFDKIYGYMKNFTKIIPQGSPIAAIGNPYQVQSLSNCFVIKAPEDSYGGIMRADQEEAQIMKRRGGVGFDISTIRPKGLPTKNSAKTTDGIGVFMERFSNTCREVAQGGRRGALMLSNDIRSKDIDTFITIKRDLKKVTGANISVRINDEFMNAVETDGEYTQKFPIDVPDDEALVFERVKARKVWDLIVESAHMSAEPGVLFWDTILRESPADCYSKFGYKTTSTNPCAELPLSDYDSCRLLLLNSLSFVKNQFTQNAYFDKDEFSDAVLSAQRMMDDIVDLELESIDKILAKIDSDNEDESVKTVEKRLWTKIRETCSNGRRTGLGLTAVGDAIAAMNMKYGSDESITFVGDVYKALAVNAYKSSALLAKERGAFFYHDHNLEKGNPFLERLMSQDKELAKLHKKYGRRNIAILTTAPAGSISTLAQTTSGIEPVFMLKYTRRKRIAPSDVTARVDFVDPMGDRWQEFTVYHHGIKRWMDITGKSDLRESPYYNSTATEIDWIKAVDIQAAAQKFIDHSLSKTINLPSDASLKTVNDVYMHAWKTGCKGITIYRDGCRQGVLISESVKKQDEFSVTNAPKRPETLTCDIHNVNIKGETWTIFVGKYQDRPYEIFGGLSEFISLPKRAKSGLLKKHARKTTRSIYDLTVGEGDDEIVIKDLVKTFANPTHGAFTRTLSLALRHGTPVNFVVEQLLKDEQDSDMFSFSRVISRVLKQYIKDGTKASNDTCPNCGNTEMKYQEGCVSCTSCSYSKCS